MLGTMLTVFKYNVLSLFFFLTPLRVRHEVITVMALKLRDARDTVQLRVAEWELSGAFSQAWGRLLYYTQLYTAIHNHTHTSKDVRDELFN